MLLALDTAKQETLQAVLRMEARVTSGAVWELWQDMRAAQPLVQCITNYVSMDLMANTLLAAGASPAMVHTTSIKNIFLLYPPAQHDRWDVQSG